MLRVSFALAFILTVTSLIAHPGHDHSHQHTHATVATLDEKNWDKYAPRGKEVDAIYGDQVLYFCPDGSAVPVCDGPFGYHQMRRLWEF